MERQKAQIKYNDLVELLKHNYRDIILQDLKDWEIVVVDENGQMLGKFVLASDKKGA